MVTRPPTPHPSRGTRRGRSARGKGVSHGPHLWWHVAPTSGGRNSRLTFSPPPLTGIPRRWQRCGRACSASAFASRRRRSFACRVSCVPRQALLAFATGAAAAVAGTFAVTQTVWRRAQLQGDAADKHVADLQKLQGTYHEASRRQACHAHATQYKRSLRHNLVARAHLTTLVFRVVCVQPMAVPSLLDLRLRRDLSRCVCTSTTSLISMLTPNGQSLAFPCVRVQLVERNGLRGL